jgi:L-ascorbate metabolism protein UlaG (beta-lactamase superfamily)
MTKVTKYAQSCLLLEKDGHALLIDPGSYVYERNHMTPDNWPMLDGVLVTHEHSDHADQTGLQRIVERFHCPIITNASFAAILNQASIAATPIAPYEMMTIGTWHIKGVPQQHGNLPPDNKPGSHKIPQDFMGGTPGPEDIGFIVDETFYTPGDSRPMPVMPHMPVFFVPVAGPEMNFDTARRMVETARPKVIVPIHFSNTKKYPIDIEQVKSFNVGDVETVFLKDGESMQWPR